MPPILFRMRPKVPEHRKKLHFRLFFHLFFFHKIFIIAKAPLAGSFCQTRLRSCYVLCARAFVAIDYIECNGITFTEIFVHYALQVFSVKEEILRFAFASNESETFLRKSFDCSSLHIVCYFLQKPRPQFLSVHRIARHTSDVKAF